MPRTVGKIKAVPVIRDGLFSLFTMKKLRSGYTTGACAAAAAKGAAIALLSAKTCNAVEIPFPDGSRVTFNLAQCELRSILSVATATVVKDAGDDPDVTNGADICATVQHASTAQTPQIQIDGGIGVGTVTKKGLAVAIGEPAINPVPREMIESAVLEAIEEVGCDSSTKLQVEIFVPKGVELAEKTLNERLGIIGGISILGTTGIVRPISADAWTATIRTAMEVAAAGGNREIVLSTGRTSEAALQRAASFSPEAYIMMGDYLEFSLLEARKFPFTKIHMSGMWAKIIKAALRMPHTHVRFGALEIENAFQLLQQLNNGYEVEYLDGANTAREMYERLITHGDHDLVNKVCMAAREYHQEISGKSVTVYLVHHNGNIVAQAG